MERHVIDGVELQLAHPDELTVDWVGQSFVMDQLMAAWIEFDPSEPPMNPRILGRPGVGKTSLAWATGRRLGAEVYIVQATMDTRPEDLLVTPVLGEDQRIRYVASGLVTAMVRGGVCVLDEGNRMTEKAWASLAPLLDTRRYVESIVAGIKIRAHPGFRFCSTMNEDASTFEIPEYIHSRLQPQIRLEFPSRDEELAILRETVPRARDELLGYVADFLSRAHEADERFSVRDGINIARFATRILSAQDRGMLPELPRHGPRPGLRTVRAPAGAGPLAGWLQEALVRLQDDPGRPRAAAVPVGSGPGSGPVGPARGDDAGPSPAPDLPASGDPLHDALRHAAVAILGEEALRHLDAPPPPRLRG